MQEEKDKVEEEIEEGQEIEIEEEKVEDDKQEVVADSKAPAEEEKQDDSDADDLSEYSESVKKRISKLTSKFREEERQRNEAIKFAESVKKQNEELKAKLNKLDETGKGINLQRLIENRAKELRTDPLEDYNFKQAQRQSNFEYVIGPKIEEETGKTVQGNIEFDDDENTYDTDGKQPGIYYDPFRNAYVEITNELEVIINPPEILNVLK